MCSPLTSWPPRAAPADTLRARTGPARWCVVTSCAQASVEENQAAVKRRPSLRCDWNHDFLSRRIFSLTSIVGSVVLYLLLDKPDSEGSERELTHRVKTTRVYIEPFQGDFLSAKRGGGSVSEWRERKKRIRKLSGSILLRATKKKAGFQPRAIQAFVSAEILQVSANLRGLDVVWSICRLVFFNRKANFWHQSPEAHGSSDSKLWRFVLQHRCCFCWNRDLFFSWHAHTEMFLSLTGISDCLMSCMQKPKTQNCFPKKTKAMFYNLVSESNTKRICRAAVRSCKRFKVSLRLKLWQWATIYLIFPPVRPGWVKK